MFLDLDLKEEYRSFRDDITRSFFNPVLACSIKYDRAVGYFSSTALTEVTNGIRSLVENGGRIRIIASPQLTEEDLLAIHEGYKKRDELIYQSVLNDFDRELDVFEKKRLNFLMNLIAKGYLEIKIAMLESKSGIGIYHEKMGLMHDKNYNVIAFTGSLNETRTAMVHNYESIDVYRSWNESEKKRVQSKETAFNRIWNNEEDCVQTFNVSDETMNFLMQFKVNDELELDIDIQEKKEKTEVVKEIEFDYIFNPKIPNNIEIREYQNEAIKNWVEQNYCGIFDMATGTGKTITGLAAATHLSNHLNHNLAIVIVCPYRHLVMQWVEDIELFNMQPIIGFSGSPQRKWRESLKEEIRDYNIGISKHFCFITTNSTFGSSYVQEKLSQIKGDILLIVDEAHNFGAEYLKTTLPGYVKYRLALSATIHRHGDEEGTEFLFQYFGEKCIEYTLEMAIQNDMLTPYRYYPIIVNLTENELIEYRELSKKIAKSIRKNKFGKVEVSETAKMLLLKRARIVAGAQNKIAALEEAVTKYRNENHILVYCGATTINDSGYTEGLSEEEEIRQIDVVTRLLGRNLGMKVARFTSSESPKEREKIKDKFDKGENLQALVAIRCLDEGVNIPSIDKAFILASSTNPKEYIQRRGRVLRKFKGKNESIIYDFITLPVHFSDVTQFTEEEIRSLQGLVKRELERMIDFASIALNSSYTAEIMEEIKESYLLYFDDEVMIDEYI